MNNGIYAVVKRYEQNGIEFADWHFKPNNHCGIYNKMMELTENDHEISDEAACWCDSSVIGSVYEFREGEIEIQYID